MQQLTGWFPLLPWLLVSTSASQSTFCAHQLPGHTTLWSCRKIEFCLCFKAGFTGPAQPKFPSSPDKSDSEEPPPPCFPYGSWGLHQDITGSSPPYQARFLGWVCFSCLHLLALLYPISSLATPRGCTHPHATPEAASTPMPSLRLCAPAVHRSSLSSLLNVLARVTACVACPQCVA